MARPVLHQPPGAASAGSHFAPQPASDRLSPQPFSVVRQNAGVWRVSLNNERLNVGKVSNEQQFIVADCHPRRANNPGVIDI
jgi:hypothetical protein